MKKAIIISFLFLTLIALTATAYASTSLVYVEANVYQPKLFGVFSFNVPLGQAIEVQFNVKNLGTSAVLINKAKVIITDPSGNVRLNQIYALPATILNPGQSKTFTVKTNLVADKEGLWTVKVEVYSNNVKLGSDTKTFTVTGTTTSVEITQVAGYALASAGILGAAWYLIKKKVVALRR